MASILNSFWPTQSHQPQNVRVYNKSNNRQITKRMDQKLEDIEAAMKEAYGFGDNHSYGCVVVGGAR